MRRYLTAIVICGLQLGCDQMLLGPEDPLGTAEYLKPPPALEDGIEVSTMSREGIDSARLIDLITHLQKNGSGGTRSILIARNNKLVLEAYFNGWHRERRQNLRSASKSFVSAIMGIAIDKAVVPGVDEKILGYFPEYQHYENWDERKANMTIRDFLRMRTGLACNDRTSASPGYQEKIYVEDDWIKFLLDLPVAADPGEQFSYCSGAPIVLSAVVKKASGMTSYRFADENLFAPLGITDYVWEYMPARKDFAGGQFHMRSRDMLKFGLLFLNDGVWNGQRIISAEWIAESTTPDGAVPGERFGTQYGYLWWFASWDIHGKKINAYHARGNGGQFLYVIKELNLVVAFTGGAYDTNVDAKLYALMENTILPAVVD